MKFYQYACLSDNYGVLVHSSATGETACIDVPDAAATQTALKETGWSLSHIFVTHHHVDHVQGVEEIKGETGAIVIGPDNPDIADIDRRVGDGDEFSFGGEQVQVIATPGHTLDMLNFYLPDAGVAFTADTLFAMGCGRIFEGTPQQMWQSLKKLMSLPPETRIYCGHEYTLANAKFAVTVDGDNPALKARLAEVEQLRAAGKPTLPTTMARELATNPFLRVNDDSLRANLGMADASDEAVFAEVRKRKDNA